MSKTDAIVVGAGVAGLTCARELTRRGIRTVVLERSRGVGGRCATRRVEGGQRVDHGVPFLHGASAAFCAAFDDVDAAGKVEGWPVRVKGQRLACQPDAFRQGRMRMAHHDGVNEFPKMLARGLDVRREHPVETIEDAGDHLVVRVGGQDAFEAPIVVMAAHAPVSLRLLEPCVSSWPHAEDGLSLMRRANLVPCLTVIAGYPLDGPELDFDIWYPFESLTLHTISHDSTKRPEPKWRVLVLQARPPFSHDYIDHDPETWKREILQEAGDLLGPWAAEPAWVDVHRWEAARSREPLATGQSPWFESKGGARIGVIGDSFSHHPGLQGAFESGTDLGVRIAGMPIPRSG